MKICCVVSAVFSPTDILISVFFLIEVKFEGILIWISFECGKQINEQWLRRVEIKDTRYRLYI